jgi:uncharacterized glyoxalase superfamily protein PhnB
MKTIQLEPAIPQLPSGDLKETASFFQKFLGFETVAEFPTMVILKRDKSEIHFWLTESNEQAKQLGSMSSCYIRTNQVEELFQEFQNRGAKFRYELTKQPWGMLEMQIDDPFGNAVRFGKEI